MKLIYKTHPPFECRYTKSFESNQFVKVSREFEKFFVLIRENFVFIRERFSKLRVYSRKICFFLRKWAKWVFVEYFNLGKHEHVNKIVNLIADPCLNKKVRLRDQNPARLEFCCGPRVCNREGVQTEQT